MGERLEPGGHRGSADHVACGDVHQVRVHVGELVVTVGIVGGERHHGAVPREVVAADAGPRSTGRVERRRGRRERPEIVTVDSAGLPSDASERGRLPVIDPAREVLLREAEIDLRRRRRHAAAVGSRANDHLDRVAITVAVRHVVPGALRKGHPATAARASANIGHRVARALDLHGRDGVHEVDLVDLRSRRRLELHLEYVHVRGKQHAVERIRELGRRKDGRCALRRSDGRELRTAWTPVRRATAVRARAGGPSSTEDRAAAVARGPRCPVRSATPGGRSAMREEQRTEEADNQCGRRTNP